MKKIVSVVLLAAALFVMPACSAKSSKGLLNPDKPITITLWHYYNGNSKEAFDQLVNEFNETIGMEKGIVVDAQSQGDVTQLATAVFAAANASIGAAPMPNIFASYADNAFRVHQTAKLTSLDQYFSESELAEYRPEFLEEGRFVADNKYYIVPVAKSSENLYVNKNHWEPFAQRHSFTQADLSTWEGLCKVAKVYHEETGRSFFGLDANANYLLVAGMQLDNELYRYAEDGSVTFELKRDTARKIWDNFYLPYVRGYFAKSGRFSSDDAKTCTVISYTGSTAGAAYFPTTVEFEGTTQSDILPLVLPYPYFADGKRIAIQQGAGMCIAQSDKAHEYAAALFLKWFTNTEQNLKFAMSTGYFPVENAALESSMLQKEAEAGNISSPAILESIKATDTMFKTYALYNSRAFLGSYEMRSFLDSQLISKIHSDLAALEIAQQQNQNTAALLEAMESDQAFENWYAQITQEAQLILKQK